MTLVRWDPVRELAGMEVDRLSRMFSDFYGDVFSRTWVPPVDIYETPEHEYVIKAELPEMKREDINITFENNVLTLRGERKFEHDTRREASSVSSASTAASRARSRCPRPWTATASARATRTAC